MLTMGEKLIVVLGGGESGVGSAILAQKKGFRVFLSDNGLLQEEHRESLRRHTIDFEEGGHTEERVLEADEIVKSPGIPDTVPLMLKVLDKEIHVISEIEFAGRYTDAKMICITGSNGKTTTASLIYHILIAAGLNVGLGGNIGKSFARQVAEEHFDYYVLELSSFQLEGVYDFKADIAVLLNITPDHLDRYDHNMQRYVDAKMRIIRNQKVEDAFIYWIDDPVVTKEMEKLQPASSHSLSILPSHIPDQVPIGKKGFPLNFNATIGGIFLFIATLDLSMLFPLSFLNSVMASSPDLLFRLSQITSAIFLYPLLL